MERSYDWLRQVQKDLLLDYFDKKMAEEAINATEEILRWCRNIINK